MYALVDCNNFFVSCERVFRPDLENKPVIVLSNNDGCAVARSNEVKALGIPMGAPIFKYKDLVAKHNIQLFSGNFPLYGDISNRIVQVLRKFTPQLEVYSIDESFLKLNHLPEKDLLKHGQIIKQAVAKWVGVPVSVGIAPTKTLAKAANEIAKMHSQFSGVLYLMGQNELGSNSDLLELLPINDVWGVGRQHTKLLKAHGIFTAQQLRDLPLNWVEQKLHVQGKRMVMELRGTVCFTTNNHLEPRKTVITSRSFGTPVTEFQDLKEAVASYVCRAAEKLRQEDLQARFITVYLKTSPHRRDVRYYSNSYTISLPEPSNYNPLLIEKSIEALKHIYLPNLAYKKAGILLSELVPTSQTQLNLLESVSNRTTQLQLMKVVDKINHHYGSRTIRQAATGLSKPWKLKQQSRSPRYTTKWSEIIEVKAN